MTDLFTIWMLKVGIWRRETNVVFRLLSYMPAYVFWFFFVWFWYYAIDFGGFHSHMLAEYGVFNNAGLRRLAMESPNLASEIAFIENMVGFGLPLLIVGQVELRILIDKFFLSKEKYQAKIDKKRENIEKIKGMWSHGAVVNSTDKTDIGYWHGLLEKGAITEEEFNRKKAELL
jgi:hypothetical protein